MRCFAGLSVAALVLAGCAGADVGSDGDSSSDAVTTAPAYTPPPAYAEGKLTSDLTPEVVAHLKEIAAQGDGDPHAFIKVGDSITFSTSFLDCFATTPLTDDPAAAAFEETRTFFEPASWSRQSIASTVGWHTNQPLAGDPSPLAKEIAAMHPSYAVVMLGTNDEYEGTEPSYEQNLTKLVQTIAAQGIVPILSTIPPIRNATQNEVVPKMNLIVRKVAAENQIPLMDFHATLADLPGYGLGGDGIHPAAAPAGACGFDDAAMKFGYNQRNLLAITALDRVRRALE